MGTARPARPDRDRPCLDRREGARFTPLLAPPLRPLQPTFFFSSSFCCLVCSPLGVFGAVFCCFVCLANCTQINGSSSWPWICPSTEQTCKVSAMAVIFYGHDGGIQHCLPLRMRPLVRTVVVVFVVLTSTRMIIKCVVAEQAPVTLELWRNTPGKKHKQNQERYTHKS